ncbi:MAG TPA: glycosyltransferase family 39 protein, partial [Solirubrobacteraceae bacterium]|nr:glycosyltransferase family 39 protein [Solirubrobacteraceae bacterium]
MSSDSIPYAAPRAWRLRGRTRGRVRLERLFARPELLGLLGLTAALNLWNLSINGWANTYYSAAVRSMSTSWHDFLYASLDKTGLMTVDKPPLALWVEALSARVFGFHPLSVLVPEALMGVAAVALLYDLVARRFGRAAGFVGGLAFAVTPVTVAVARHNNPDELLILCCVAAIWAALRALENGKTRWLVLSGVFVGLGFETKMGVALMIVPGIAAAWMWVAKGSLWARARQLLAGGAAMVAVGGAWPLLVTLTPAADRPWISGTSDNSIWSLIFGYNGLGRVAGQSGGPGGAGGAGGGSLFGGPTGLFRLLQTGLGDQAGWLLGFSLVAGVGILVLTRLRRRDPRTGWLIVVGGAFLVTAVVFSLASGIFHPYYVSFLAPFAAALVGAGVGLMLPASFGGVGRARTARVLAPLAILGGLVTELIVLGETGGALSWAEPLLIAVGGLCAVALTVRLPRRVHAVLVAAALAALLAAPATWAAETLGHATSSTFPTGGPAAASVGGPGGFAGHAGGGFPPGGGFGARGGFRGPPPAGAFPGGARGGFGGGGSTLTAAVTYVDQHGGGTIGVSSQSSAATVILSSGGNVAGLGGFSGRESSVTASWLASEVSSGRLRWLLADGTQAGGLPGDTRIGSQSAFAIAERVAR